MSEELNLDDTQEQLHEEDIKQAEVWGLPPAEQEQAHDAIETVRQLEQQNAETDKTKEPQTDSETAAKNQAKFRQEIEEGQGEEEW